MRTFGFYFWVTLAFIVVGPVSMLLGHRLNSLPYWSTFSPFFVCVLTGVMLISPVRIAATFKEKIWKRILFFPLALCPFLLALGILMDWFSNLIPGLIPRSVTNGFLAGNLSNVLAIVGAPLFLVGCMVIRAPVIRKSFRIQGICLLIASLVIVAQVLWNFIGDSDKRGQWVIFGIELSFVPLAVLHFRLWRHLLATEELSTAVEQIGKPERV